MHNCVVVRGAGDLATGVIQKLYRAGFAVVALEVEKPLAIRRAVALCEAVYNGTQTVEDVTAVKTEMNISAVEKIWKENKVPILIDEHAKAIEWLKPIAVVDAIIAKKNLGTNKKMANITIGLGPGFYAPTDVDIVIETMRGHNLGRLIFDGCALKNSHEPASIDGVSNERVVYSLYDGKLKLVKQIGEFVCCNALIAYVDKYEVYARTSGVVRGLLPDGFYVNKGLKLADIDPRGVHDNCFTISDKARAIGGAVLEGILIKVNK